MLAQLSFAIPQWAQAALLPPSPAGQSDGTVLFGPVNACPVAEPPHSDFAFVSLLPTPLLDLGERHRYICQLPFHTTSENAAVPLLTQQSQQSYVGNRPSLCTTEMLVTGVLPAEIRRVSCLVAICSGVHVPKPKFFSGLITNKPI